MSKTGKALLIPALILPVLPVAAYAWLASFTRLLGDDFCSFYFAGRFGLLRSIWYWRLSWSGRYSAFIADWLVTKLVGPYGLRVLLPLFLLLWLALTWAAIHALLRRYAAGGSTWLPAGALSTALLMLVLVVAPDVPQSYLWWNGMRSYSLPLIVLAAYMLLFHLIGERIKPWQALLLWLVLIFLSGGLSETFAVFQLCLLLFLLGLRLLRAAHRKMDVPMAALLGGLAGAALGLLVIVTAPGNAVRQLELPPAPGLAEILTISLQGYRHYLQIFLFPVQMSAALGALLLAFWIGSFFPAAGAGPWRPLLWVLGGLALSFACFPPAVYGYSEPPPPRTVIIPFFALSACLMTAAFLRGAGLAKAQEFPARAGAGVALAALLLLGYASLRHAGALLDQAPAYRAYAQYWDGSDAHIRTRAAAGDAAVTIPVQENWARINVLNDNPKFWVNECYSQYYGVSVLAETPREAP